MTHRILTVLTVLTPILVLFSGMAMTPLLILVTLLVAFSARGLIEDARVFLPNYRVLIGLLAVMLALPFITTAWSITPHTSLVTSTVVALLCAAGAFAFIYSPTLDSPGRKVLYYYGFGFVAVGLLLIQEQLLNGGLIQYIFVELMHKDYTRFVLKNVNRGLCALVVFIWPLMLGLYLKGKKQDAWMIFIIFAAGVLVMHSLSAKVGLVAGALAFFALRRWPVFISRAIVVVFSLFLLSFPLLFHVSETRFFTLPAVQAHLPESSQHRLRIWHVLLEEVQEKPLLGWGMDTTRAMPLSQEQLDYIWLQGPPLHPHSPSIQILLEQGVIGLLLTVGAFALLLREWMRMPRHEELHRATAGALIVAYFTAGISSFGIWQAWWIATMWVAALLWRWFGRERVPVSV